MKTALRHGPIIWLVPMPLVGLVLFSAVRTAQLSVSEPPPYTFNLDQSVICPRDVNNAWYAHDRHVGAPQPVLANASEELAALVAGVDASLDADMKELNAPSAMIVASVNGKTLFESYRGTARLGKAVKVGPDSGFMVASNSKVFTSVMLYQLRDRGLLPQGLDTTVAQILPGWVEPLRGRAPL